MAKLPKFSELTDVNKLKEFGSSIASQAKVGEMIDKVKAGASQAKMGEMLDKVKAGVESVTGNKKEEADTSGDPIQQQFNELGKSLKQVITQHKAQSEAISQLSKQVKQLHGLLQTAMQSEEAEEVEETTDENDDFPPEETEQ